MTCSPVLRCLLAAFAALLFLVADAPSEPPHAGAAVGDIFEFPIPTPNSQPESLVRSWDGTVWFNGVHNKLGRLGPGGITEFPLATPGGVGRLALAGDGTVWFNRGASVAMAHPDGTITEYPVPVPGYYAGITAGPDDAMWFTYGNAAKIGRVTMSGVVTVTDLATTDASGMGPITTGADGNLWVVNYPGNRILRVTPAFAVTEFTLPTPGGNPLGITTGPDGNVWFTEYNSFKVGRITPTGVITEFPLPPGALNPHQITAGTDGALWFTEQNSNMIGRITTSGVITRYPIPTLNSEPVGITPCGVLICFTERGANKIGVLENGSSIVVNTLADANPSVTDGLCSLREAITNANNNAATFPDCAPGARADRITFSVNGTVSLVASLPDVADYGGLLIDGTGHAVSVDGMGSHRLIWTPASLEVRNLELTRGNAGPGGLGGAISSGTYNTGQLLLVDTTIRDNQAYHGGGIEAAQRAIIYRSRVVGNVAEHLGGGIHGAGQGIVVIDSTISDNNAYFGGGIFAGPITVRGSTFSGNSNNGIASNGVVSIANSTFSGNSAAFEAGGGIFMYSYSGSQLTIWNSTVTGNHTDSSFGGGGVYAPGIVATLGNAIIADNTGTPGPDCVGSFVASGPNLLSNSSSCSISGIAPITSPPLLAPLEENGGPTKTHGLLPGSPAIDAGSDVVCARAPVSKVDQRGMPRPEGMHCDLGAFDGVELPFLSISDQSAFEGPTGITQFAFAVTLAPAPIAPVTVHVATANGTATSGSDYTAILDTLLTFAPGETSKPVTVLVNGDTTPEPNETFFVNLSNPSGALIADGQGVGTILDDDTPGAIIVDKVALPSGDPQSFSFTPSYGAPFALTDTAPPHASGPLLMGVYSVAEVVPAGWVQTGAVCSDGSPVGAIDLSPGETVTCTFTNTKKGNVTLQNVMVGGTATFSYSGTPSGAISINGGTLTDLVAPGTHTTTQSPPAGWTLISILCDDGDSGGVVASGQVTFQVAPGENVTCIVTNTKAAISVDDMSVTEGNSGTKLLTFTVTRNAGLFVHDVAVDYATLDVSASAGSDYVTANGTLTIPKTSASGTVSITINGDTEFEIDETLKLLLSNPKNAVLTTPFGTGTILNDDAPSNPIGGKNLTITTGSIDLSWETGTTQTGYALLQYNTSTGVPTIINLPGAATSHSDAAAVNGVVYCYVLAALGPGGAFLGLSDLLCGMAGAESGTVIPQGFDLTLGQTASATMTWAAPVAGADSYLLQRIPLDGSPITNVPLAGTATTSTQAVVAAGTCFQLIAFKGAAFGTSDVLCGVPGVSTLVTQPVGQRSVAAVFADVMERLAASPVREIRRPSSEPVKGTD